MGYDDTDRTVSGVKHSFRSTTIRFPDVLFEIPAAVGAVGKVGIPRVLRDFQGRWKGRKTCFWFSSLSTARLFPQPFGRRVCVVRKIIDGHFASADSKPASRFFLACSMR